MKNNIKFKYIFISFLVLLSILFSNVYASTSTEIRTKDNLKIWDDIEVTSSVESAALDTLKVNEEEKIYDFAGLLKNDEEMEIYSDIEEFINKFDIDMVVVTINYNDKFSSLKYANDFYNYNYFGKNNTRDGIIILIDKVYKQVCILPKGEAILIYDKEKINNMLNSINYYLEYSNYKEAIDKFIFEANKYANNSENSSNKTAFENEDGTKSVLWEVVFSTLIIEVMFVPIIITLIYITVRDYKNIRRVCKIDDYFNKNSVKIIDEKDICVNSVTTKKLIKDISEDVI